MKPRPGRIPALSTDLLQKIFRTLGDPTRVRILALLEREELAVHELMEALGMAQSRVSRHLGILREAGLLRDRREARPAMASGGAGTHPGRPQGVPALR